MLDHLSQTFSALADPTRRAMLIRLKEGEASVSDLARPFLKDMSLPAVTKHVKVLERAGLITKTRDAQWRPCKLNGEGLKDAVDWMEQYRKFWEESFDRLDEYLKTVMAKTKVKTETAKTDVKPVTAKSNVKSVAAKSNVKTDSSKTKKKGKKHGHDPKTQ